MAEFQTILVPLLAWIEASKYILLFFGAIFEGPVLMVASGFLYHQGAFVFLPMYLVLVAGDFVADMGWYALGRFGGRPLVLRFGKRFGITERAVEKIQTRFHKYHEKILIISKLTMGFGFALVTLVVAGMLHVPFKKYVILNLLGGFVWTGLLLVIGYFFGNVFALLSGTDKIVFLVIGFTLFIAGIKLGNNYLSRKDI